MYVYSGTAHAYSVDCCIEALSFFGFVQIGSTHRWKMLTEKLEKIVKSTIRVLNSLTPNNYKYIIILTNQLYLLQDCFLIVMNT
ncbi:zinc finger MYM-type protein 1-like [Aphis craccivora]|uniref:Zinc finger MYM-type protein 1-like n=1 Tax=Aphis craccivora TaxID=307492 RepID=A0A6G0VQJ7_APHCR|nr:zinc finger MYM-type protein 1-like [Aphis craccivora]